MTNFAKSGDSFYLVLFHLRIEHKIVEDRYERLETQLFLLERTEDQVGVGEVEVEAFELLRQFDRSVSLKQSGQISLQIWWNL